jgi:hypothetical protein
MHSIDQKWAGSKLCFMQGCGSWFCKLNKAMLAIALLAVAAFANLDQPLSPKSLQIFSDLSRSPQIFSGFLR